jgi:CubicO group peptidase (beta-lactamase class C family)
VGRFDGVSSCHHGPRSGPYSDPNWLITEGEASLSAGVRKSLSALHTTPLTEPQILGSLRHADVVGELGQPADQFGAAVLVVRDGAILFESASGPADVTAPRPVTMATRFQVSSVSKQWVATIFGLLSERGLIDWDDRIDQWFPALPYGPEISVQQLLCHTSGLGHWDEVGGHDVFALLDDSERIEVLGRTPLRSRPGTSWSYSGLGYVLLGQIASATVQRPYPAIVEREIIADLGLSDTTCGRPADPGAAVALGNRGRDASPLLALASLPGTGDIWSTARDLAKYAAAFQEGRLVRPATVRTLLESGVGLGESSYSTEWVSAARYGYGRYIGTLAGRPAWFHSGDNPGFQSFLGHLPRARATVVVLCNADDVPITDLVKDTLREAGLLTSE